MKLTHFSKEKINGLTMRDVFSSRNPIKPAGLWYSVDGGWEEWCSDNEPGWICGVYKYELILGNENILRLATPKAILDFQSQFNTQHADYQRIINPIDWGKVAEQYDGIEIAPYQWSLRLDLLWYYGWDCASGCLWRPNGAELRFIQKIPKLKENCDAVPR